jgi:hypothetical protein
VASLVLLVLFYLSLIYFLRGFTRHFVSVWPFGFIYKSGRMFLFRGGKARFRGLFFRGFIGDALIVYSGIMKKVITKVRVGLLSEATCAILKRSLSILGFGC